MFQTSCNFLVAKYLLLHFILTLKRKKSLIFNRSCRVGEFFFFNLQGLIFFVKTSTFRWDNKKLPLLCKNLSENAKNWKNVFSKNNFLNDSPKFLIVYWNIQLKSLKNIKFSLTLINKVIADRWSMGRCKKHAKMINFRSIKY